MILKKIVEEISTQILYEYEHYDFYHWDEVDELIKEVVKRTIYKIVKEQCPTCKRISDASCKDPWHNH